MPRRKLPKKLKKGSRSKPGLGFIVVKNKSYGKLLKGTKIYFEGKKPKQLKKDGSINLGKHILEALTAKFPKFRWIISKETDSITLERNIYRIRTSEKLLRIMGVELWDRTRDIKNDIVRHLFAVTFPTHFEKTDTAVYVPGALSKILDPKIVRTLSGEDREAIINFLPDFIASESIGSVNLLKATTEIKSLRELAEHLEQGINDNHPESWWQNFIRKNILIIQQGYIKPIEKMNIGIGTAKLPDFSLVTHDNYLDILEIKKPNTTLLKPDESRGNYFWDNELSKAIIQVENYLSNVSTHRDPIRSYLKDTHSIDLQVLKPRGIILAGDTGKFTTQKEKDDFRLLSHSLKNITVVTYDELLTRLKNYIKILEEFGAKIAATPPSSKASQKNSEAVPVH